MINDINEDNKEIENSDNKDNQLIEIRKENNSSFENISGEEEDEDDLLKSENESNTSCKSIRGISDQNNKIKIKQDPLSLLSSLQGIKPIKLEEKNLEKIENEKDNKLENIEYNSDLDKGQLSITLRGTLTDKELRENKSNLSDISNHSYKRDRERERNASRDLSRKDLRDRERERNASRDITRKDLRDEEEEYEDEGDDDNEEDDESEESESESINPYNEYKKSKTSYKSLIYYLKKTDYLFKKNSKKYYIYITRFYDHHIIVNYEIENKKKKHDIFKKIIDETIKRCLKNHEEFINELIEEINQPIYLASIKKEENLLKNEIIMLDNDDYNNNYSTTKKIKMYYLNYLNKKYSFNIFININWKINNLLSFLSKIYHFPNINPSNVIISSFIKNEEYTGDGTIYKKKRIFSPKYFDYEKDYILILENENFDKINIDLGSNNSKYNFKGEIIPHIVFSSYYNFYVESVIVSKRLRYLECEVYVFKDEHYFNLERNIGKYNFKNAKEALSSLDWKKKCNYVTSIKSIKSSIYKNNDEAIIFDLSTKLILYHDKSYVFLITSPNLNINVFNSGSGDQGLFIISLDDKAILNGFICKKISDLALDN